MADRGSADQKVRKEVQSRKWKESEEWEWRWMDVDEYGWGGHG